MKIRNKKSILFFLAVLVLPLLAFTGLRWYENNLEDLPYFGKNYTIDQPDDQHTEVPGFNFTDQDSTGITSNFIKDKIWVVHFFFTSCPSICPVMIDNMKLVQAAYAKDHLVKIISITVDPKYDIPSRLKRYSLKKGIKTPQWVLVTGSKQDIYRFARKALFIDATDGDGGEGDFIHSEKLVLVDPQRHIRGYYDGTDLSDIEQLIRDIQKLKTNDANE